MCQKYNDDGKSALYQSRNCHISDHAQKLHDNILHSSKQSERRGQFLTIRKCFTFLPGIGEKVERRIKDQSIDNWNEFLKRDCIKGISAKRKGYYDRELKKAGRCLLHDVKYFVKNLPRVEHWRLYELYRDEAVFLDIESTGIDGYITVVGLFDGYEVKTMIYGINLDLDRLAEELFRYKMIITFNGNVFDIPYIRKRYKGVVPDVLQVDIRFLCQRLGIKGGLKEIEQRMGIKRSKIVEKLTGGDPAKLFRMYRGSGDDHYLKLLIEYNEEDVVNLQKIMDYCYDKLSRH